MIILSNLRLEVNSINNNLIKLVCDIECKENPSLFKEKTIWYETEMKNAQMFNNETYNAFLLVPLYLAMYYKYDLVIKGAISKKLYFNIKNYIQKILCDFSKDLSMVDVIVEETKELNFNGAIIGTGISCGIDSLSTIYDHFVKEKDNKYKINKLFIFNCGTHGDFENPNTQKIFETRLSLNKEAANDLGLGVVTINTNMHYFTHKIAELKVGHFALWSCALSMEKMINKYFISSAYSYEEIVKYHDDSRDYSMAGFCESYLIPLINTESIELISDGGQYYRTEKTANITDWKIAQKYLNVCVKPGNDAHNCCKCSKCMRTLITLEALGKLQNFSTVFDLNVYANYARANKLLISSKVSHDAYSVDIYNLMKKNIKTPNKIEIFLFRVKIFIRKVLNKGKKLIRG